MKRTVLQLAVGLAAGLALAAVLTPAAAQAQVVVVVRGSADGGTAIATVPAQCGNPTPLFTTLASNRSLPVPATALSGRRAILICNTAEGAGTPLVKCREDGALPTMGAPNPGLVLNKSECVTYYVGALAADGGNPVNCISDTADAGVSSSECR